MANEVRLVRDCSHWGAELPAAIKMQVLAHLENDELLNVWRVCQVWRTATDAFIEKPFYRDSVQRLLGAIPLCMGRGMRQIRNWDLDVSDVDSGGVFEPRTPELAYQIGLHRFIWSRSIIDDCISIRNPHAILYTDRLNHSNYHKKCDLKNRREVLLTDQEYQEESGQGGDIFESSLDFRRYHNVKDIRAFIPPNHLKVDWSEVPDLESRFFTQVKTKAGYTLAALSNGTIAVFKEGETESLYVFKNPGWFVVDFDVGAKSLIASLSHFSLDRPQPSALRAWDLHCGDFLQERTFAVCPVKLRYFEPNRLIMATNNGHIVVLDPRLDVPDDDRFIPVADVPLPARPEAAPVIRMRRELNAEDYAFFVCVVICIVVLSVIICGALYLAYLGISALL